MRIKCESSLPEAESKAKAWEIITHPSENKLSSYDYRAYCEGFYHRSQAEILSPYVEKYLSELPNFAKSGEKDYMSIFVSGAVPPSYLTTNEMLEKMK